MSKLALEVSVLNYCSNRTVDIAWISKDFRSFSMQNKITENCYLDNYIGTRSVLQTLRTFIYLA